MNFLHLDVETRSEADLKAVGPWKYSEHPTTDCLSIAWAYNQNKITSCQIIGKQNISSILSDYAQYPDIIFIARNALFDYAIMKNVLIPKYGFHPAFGDPSRWYCTAALSRMHGLPASLEDSAAYLNKTHKKLPDGKRLIQLYSIPVTDRKTGKKRFRPIPPEDMKKWLEYDKGDVAADREAFDTLYKLKNAQLEFPVFQHDFALNIKGVRIDTAGLAHLLDVVEKATERAMKDQRKYSVTWKKKDGQEYTDVLNVRSVPKLKAWLQSRGFDISNTRIETLEEIYDNLDSDQLTPELIKEVKEVLSFRFFLAKASLKKYRAAFNRVSNDGRLRYFLKYFGAHTGRYAGEGFQIHNLPKTKWPDSADPVNEIERMIKEITPDTPYNDIVERGKKILPGLMIPDKGNIFIAGDFASVEARGVAWLAGCERMLKEFRSGADLYVDMAKRINRTKPNRPLGKAAVLGCGYGMGVNKFYTTCQKWGIDIDMSTAEKAVTAYREIFAEIPRFWYALEDAFRTTWLIKKPHTVGLLHFERGGNYIRIRFPSGRWLYYHQVKIEGGQISYCNFGRKGARVNIWGGVLAENITQALCRDVLVDRMYECEKNKLPIALHVHDEIVIEVGKKRAKESQKIFDKILNTAPQWAKGFPLKTESEITRRYHK